MKYTLIFLLLPFIGLSQDEIIYPDLSKGIQIWSGVFDYATQQTNITLHKEVLYDPGVACDHDFAEEVRIGSMTMCAVLHGPCGCPDAWRNTKMICRKCFYHIREWETCEALPEKESYDQVLKRQPFSFSDSTISFVGGDGVYIRNGVNDTIWLSTVPVDTIIYHLGPDLYLDIDLPEEECQIWYVGDFGTLAEYQGPAKLEWERIPEDEIEFNRTTRIKAVYVPGLKIEDWRMIKTKHRTIWSRIGE